MPSISDKIPSPTAVRSPFRYPALRGFHPLGIRRERGETGGVGSRVHVCVSVKRRQSDEGLVTWDSRGGVGSSPYSFNSESLPLTERVLVLRPFIRPVGGLPR